MKTVRLFFAVILLAVLSPKTYAQMHDHSAMGAMKADAAKTETIKVWGNCELCKARIEKAAKVDGVTKAVWSDKTQTLALFYNPAKEKSDDVQKKIAAAGHDTEKYKGDDKAYAKLPGCCQYERKK